MKPRLSAAIAAAGLALAATADDGMWTYHQPPSELLKSRYDFDVSREWLDHLRRAEALDKVYGAQDLAREMRGQ